MTNEEAIQILADLIDSPFLHTWEKQNKALHMAIEALSAKTDLISRADAIEALDEDVMGGLNYERILQSLPSADTIAVVRCKDCRYWYEKMNKCNRCPSISGNWGVNDFCSYGERREL